MKEIKFLAFYNTLDNAENHVISPAGSGKVAYLAHVLDQLKRPTRIITASRAYPRTGNPRIEKQVNSHVRLVIPADVQGGGRIRNKVSSLVYYAQFLCYLLRTIHRNDVVMVYHSLQYMKLVAWLKKKIGFKMLLEVEEIYGDVMQKAEVSQSEMDYFRCADAYLFPTELLNRKINTEGKPYVIAHGTYLNEPAMDQTSTQLDSDRVHCVYAGTFDPMKGGAGAAVRAAEYLPENYHIHILGFGTEEEVQAVEKLTEEIREKCRCCLTYDGCLLGDDYKHFIQQCEIGLSTQNPSAAFNDTSFPSKILAYMANGLRVVSVRIPVVETSAVGDLISFYDEQTPEKVAEAIVHAHESAALDGRTRLNELDKAFQKDLKELLEQLAEAEK